MKGSAVRRTFTREEIVIRLIEQGVPRFKAERAADEEVVAGLAAPRPAVRRVKKAQSGMSVEARKFRVWCKDNEVPMPEPDYVPWLQSHNSRMELDYAWPDPDGGGVALEVQGGIFRKGGGAHTGKGHLRDIKKSNLAHETGWALLQCVPNDLFNPLTLEMVRRALTARSDDATPQEPPA